MSGEAKTIDLSQDKIRKMNEILATLFYTKLKFGKVLQRDIEIVSGKLKEVIKKKEKKTRGKGKKRKRKNKINKSRKK
jgi:hypothetical protein